MQYGDKAHKTLWDFLVLCGLGDFPVLAWNILNVPNTRMGRPPDQELKNMLKHIVSKSHSIMGEISLCALQVSIEKSTKGRFTP